MSALPAELSTGMVHGRFIVAMIDGNDDDQEPDVIPASGKIVFKAGVPYVPVPATSEGPVTVLKGPITGVLDSEGYLCTPHPVTGKPMYVGVKLLATDDPDMAVTDWTWTAEYRFDSVGAVTLAVPAHSFALPSGASVDLTTMVKVPSSPGYGIAQAEAAALRAESAAESSAEDASLAEAAADRAELVAGATDAGVAILLSDAGTDTGALFEAGLATKADTADMNTALALKADKAAVEDELALKADLSSTTAALYGKVSKGDLYTNVKDYGAVGDGIADDTTAIQAAADAAFAKSPDAELYMPLGNYKITAGVVIRCGLRASEASIYYYGTGTALQLGAAGMSMTRKHVSLPRVHQWTNGYKPTATDGTSVGVKAINFISCDLIIPFVQFFDTNVILYGAGAGFGYNTVYLQSLWGGRRGLVIDNDGDGGWANQNLILGGRISPLTQEDRYEDSSYVVVNGNSNTFLGTSLEGEDVTRYRVIISSRYNRFINCRWERTGSVGGNPRVLYRTGAISNSIQGGYNSTNLEEFWESPNAADSTGGRIDDNSPIYASANSVNATTVPSGTQVDITSWNQVNGRRFSYDPSTGEFSLRPGRWRIDATIAFNGNITGYREVKLLNGIAHEDITRAPGGSSMQSVKVSATVSVVPGRKIKIAVFQNSGAPLDLVTSNVYCTFKAEYQRVEG